MACVRSMAIRIAAVSIVLGSSSFCDRIAWGADDGRSLQGSRLFSGKLVAERPDGRSVPLNVEIRVWVISEHKFKTLPVHGFYVANSISGHVVTVINDEMQTHSPGDFWTIPNGVPMSVAVKGQTAVLQTIAVGVAQVFGENESPF
jgi:hypothetical protein